MVEYTLFFYKSMLLFYDKFSDSSADAVLDEMGRLYAQLNTKSASPRRF